MMVANAAVISGSSVEERSLSAEIFLKRQYCINVGTTLYIEGEGIRKDKREGREREERERERECVCVCA